MLFLLLVPLGGATTSRTGDELDGGRFGIPWRGVDMSQILGKSEKGAAFRLLPGAPPIDPFELMASQGVNTFRMRLWNDVCADHREGCDPARYGYGNLTGVLAVAKKVAAANMTLVLDIHYSDWWADPGHQFKPKAWAALPFDELAKAVHEFTRRSVAALVAQGTPPAVVQIGNEVTNGFLWNGTAQPCSDGGKLFCNGTDTATEWARFGRLVGAGISGCKLGCPGCAIAIHTDLGNRIHNAGIAWVVKWYTLLSQHLPPTAVTAGDPTTPSFDLIGLSLYPTWDGGSTMESVAALGTLAAAFPSTAIYIAETSYPADGEQQPEPDYPADPAGQLAFLRAVRAGLKRALPAAQHGGVLWWEGAENSWSALFDSGFVAREALRDGFRA